jgi:hypothetical protein
VPSGKGRTSGASPAAAAASEKRPAASLMG